MKRSHIIAIVIIAVAIGALIGSLADSSTYADLEEATANPGKEYHVVGTLDRSQAIVYEPSLNASLTSVSYTHLRAHETVLDLVCRLLLEKKQK